MTPNVFLAGAPKCGTTSLASWLSTHPKCFVTPKKEPHFFGDYLRRNMSISEYEGLYADAPQNAVIRLDASTSYFTMPEAVDQILSYCPEARFILMLRNPIDLVYSLHSESLYLGRENITSFEKAWNAQGLRRVGKKVPLSCSNSSMLLYRDQAMLGKSMRYLLRQHPAELVHWVFMEDLQYNPKMVYREVMKFLGLDDDGRENFPKKNSSKRHRFPRINRVLRMLGRARDNLGLPGMGIRRAFNKNLRVETPREPLTLETRRMLYSAFSEDIDILERLTRRDLSHWNPDHQSKANG